MKKIIRGLGVLVLALASQGCVKVMHTKPVFDFHSQVNEMVQASEAHHKKASEFYQGARSASSTPQAAPYPSMKNILDRLNASFKPIRAFLEESWVKIRRFQVLAANRSEIHSDWPEWDEALAIFTWYREKLPGLQKQVEEVNAASQAFNAEADAHGVGFYETKTQRDVMAKNVDGIRLTVDGIRIQLAKVRDQIREHSEATLGIVKHRKVSEGLVRLEAILDRIEAKVDPLKAKLSAYLNTPGLPAVQYRGPGIRRIQSLEQLETAMAEIRALAQEYNAESALLNK